MSSAPDAHGHAAQHDAHAAFTGEPVDVLPPDEPRTPGWLPLLGIAFFTCAAVFVLATRAPVPAVAAPAKSAEPPVPAAAAPPTPPRPQIEPLHGVRPQTGQRPPPPQGAPPMLARPPIPPPAPAPAPRH